MRHLIRLTDLSVSDFHDLLARATVYKERARSTYDGNAVMFFPPTSLRTRVAFEVGASRMGLHTVTFPPEALDKPEALKDVAGYLAQWVNIMVVRHSNIGVVESLAAANVLPVVNAMTSENHPCEVLADLFAISASADPLNLRYLFVGPDGNIGRAWAEASRAFGIDFLHCCPAGLEIPGVRWEENLTSAIAKADVVITDAPAGNEAALGAYQITAEVLDLAPAGARFSPCPPFVRGREVSADSLTHPSFVGYEFKAGLLPMQQAIMSFLLDSV